MKNKSLYVFLFGLLVGASSVYILTAFNLDKENITVNGQVLKEVQKEVLKIDPNEGLKGYGKTSSEKKSNINSSAVQDKSRVDEKVYNAEENSLATIFEDDEDRRVQQEYEKSIYDPRYDQTWKDDIYYEAYTELEKSLLSEKATISSYDCGTQSCSLVLTLNEGAKDYMNNISDYMRSIKDSPAILKSGMKRNVYITTVSPKTNPPVIKIRIGE